MDWVQRQDLGREHGILLSVTHILCVSEVRHGVSRFVKRWELFLVKPALNVNGQY